MKKIRVLNITLILIFLNIFFVLAQSTEEILEFRQLQKYTVILPCTDISTCIDTIYQKKDTLFIKIIDDRILLLDSNCNNYRTLYITGNYCSFKSKKNRISLIFPTPQYEYQFILLQVYDNIFLFEKYRGVYIMSDMSFVDKYPFYVVEYGTPIREYPYKIGKHRCKIKK